MKGAILVLMVLILISGCTIGERHTMKVDSDVVPSKISLGEHAPVKIEATATNIGSATETITADVRGTEGLNVTPPNNTIFTLKPGESRTVTFTAKLTKDAVPGDYILDVHIQTNSGDLIIDRIKLRVVEKKGLI